MKHLDRYTRKLGNTSQTSNKLRTLVLILSVMVVFVTTYMLILPVLTLDQDTAQAQGGIDVPAAEQVDVTAAEQADEQAEVVAYEGGVNDAAGDDRRQEANHC